MFANSFLLIVVVISLLLVIEKEDTRVGMVPAPAARQ